MKIPLMEALESMLDHAMFIKDLVIKKWIVSLEVIDNIYYYGSISS